MNSNSKLVSTPDSNSNSVKTKKMTVYDLCHSRFVDCANPPCEICGKKIISNAFVFPECGHRFHKDCQHSIHEKFYLESQVCQKCIKDNICHTNHIRANICLGRVFKDESAYDSNPNTVDVESDESESQHLQSLQTAKLIMELRRRIMIEISKNHYLETKGVVMNAIFDPLEYPALEKYFSHAKLPFCDTCGLQVCNICGHDISADTPTEQVIIFPDCMDVYHKECQLSTDGHLWGESMCQKCSPIWPTSEYINVDTIKLHTDLRGGLLTPEQRKETYLLIAEITRREYMYINNKFGHGVIYIDSKKYPAIKEYIQDETVQCFYCKEDSVDVNDREGTVLFSKCGHFYHKKCQIRANFDYYIRHPEICQLCRMGTFHKIEYLASNLDVNTLRRDVIELKESPENLEMCQQAISVFEHVTYSMFEFASDDDFKLKRFTIKFDFSKIPLLKKYYYDYDTNSLPICTFCSLPISPNERKMKFDCQHMFHEKCQKDFNYKPARFVDCQSCRIVNHDCLIEFNSNIDVKKLLVSSKLDHFIGEIGRRVDEMALKINYDVFSAVSQFFNMTIQERREEKTEEIDGHPLLRIDAMVDFEMYPELKRYKSIKIKCNLCYQEIVDENDTIRFKDSKCKDVFHKKCQEYFGDYYKKYSMCQRCRFVELTNQSAQSGITQNIQIESNTNIDLTSFAEYRIKEKGNFTNSDEKQYQEVEQTIDRSMMEMLSQDNPTGKFKVLIDFNTYPSMERFKINQRFTISEFSPKDPNKVPKDPKNTSVYAIEVDKSRPLEEQVSELMAKCQKGELPDTLKVERESLPSDVRKELEGLCKVVEESPAIPSVPPVTESDSASASADEMIQDFIEFEKFREARERYSSDVEESLEYNMKAVKQFMKCMKSLENFGEKKKKN
jgi:hypothetical protein